MLREKNKIIVILGPTASGKTRLGVKLCLKFNGEIVSADSRQVYKGMDIGTGKDLKEYQISLKAKSYKLKAIKYHLIDIVSPKKRFDLAQYQKMAFQAIDNILSRKKQPFLVGGTGLYIQSIVDNYNLFDAKPNIELRKKLEMLNINDLIEKFKIINKKFSAYAKVSVDRQVDIKLFNNILQNNKRRIIRYIELMEKKKMPFDKIFKKNKPKYDVLILGLTFPNEILADKIDKRLKKWLGKEDLIGEIKNLRKNGVSWKRLEEFGLEYKWISYYLRNKISYEETQEFILRDIKKFAKRQMTWFKRDKKVKWIKNYNQAEKLVKKFLKE
ncbi:MAG: tRNA (adenosine(37)-N6)-dimethylallyltransferase MiaA [Patescibacteria group bacterium]|nr:tRNA (adenosine(37)-N6)-dimethylallyltransferase MiaA [Patescibacteria group bacterium]